MDRKHMSSKRKAGSIGEQDSTARCRKRREQRLTVPKPTTAVFSEALLHDALMHISRNDPLIKPLIDKHGVPTALLPKSCDSLFGSLARSVCSQQLGTKQAASIFQRVLGCCECTSAIELTPEHVLTTAHEDLRQAGLSNSKAQYIQNIANHFQNGLIQRDRVPAMGAEDLRASLLEIKGVGPWTVDMVFMFSLGFTDILPVHDLGVRKGMMKVYALKKLPRPDQMEHIASTWRPFRSVGTYFMWKAMEE